MEDRIRRAPTLIIVNDQGEEIGSGKASSHSLWVLSRRLVRMLLQSDGPISLTSAAAVLVGPGGVSDPTQHRSQTQITVERRLYDIGSILCSIGIIERIYVKKRWVEGGLGVGGWVRGVEGRTRRRRPSPPLPALAPARPQPHPCPPPSTPPQNKRMQAARV